MGDQVGGPDRDLGHHRELRVEVGVLSVQLIEDAHEHRHDDRDHRDHDDQGQGEDDRRVHHGRSHLTPQGVQPFELVRDPVERLVQAT